VETDVHVCVKIARALGLEHALLFSTHREPSAHGRHRLSLVCVDHVATVHFSAAPISATAHAHIETLCLSVWRYTLVWVACWARVRVKSETDELCCLRMIHLDVANVFSMWIGRERNIFDPFETDCERHPLRPRYSVSTYFFFIWNSD